MDTICRLDVILTTLNQYLLHWAKQYAEKCCSMGIVTIVSTEQSNVDRVTGIHIISMGKQIAHVIYNNRNVNDF